MNKRNRASQTEASLPSMNGIILLDRDGVLNQMVVDPEHGIIDSPLNVDQVSLIPGVTTALKELTQAGYGLCIVSNQPAAAKGKTTLANLKGVHERVLNLAQQEGGRILSSHLCFHRAEDGCDCRKPKTGLLEEALQVNQWSDLKRVWMVGDGITDVQAGKTLGVKTAFFGPRKCDACKIFDSQSDYFSDHQNNHSLGSPDFWGSDLVNFTQFIFK